MGEQKRKSSFFGGDQNSAPQEPASEAPELEIGRMLSQRRQSLGYNLADIAEHLRIRETYLLAIEQGQFNQLPGTTYVHGFLRSYATLLDFDAAAVVQQYQQALHQGPPRRELYASRPVPESRKPGGLFLLIGILLAALIYGGWWVIGNRSPQQSRMVPPLPDRLAATLPRPVAPAAIPADPVAPMTETAPPVKAEPINPPSAPPTPPAILADKTDKAATPAATEPAIPPSRVLIKAIGDSWVQVRDGHGTLIKTRMMHAGDHYAVPDAPGVTMFTGDAGNLTLEVDGKSLPPLGTQGQVIRNLSLEPDKLLARSKP